MSFFFIQVGIIFKVARGLSGGAMVLGKLTVPRRSTNLNDSKARANCACSGRGWRCLNILSLVYHFSLLSPAVWEMVQYKLKYCFKQSFSLKRPTDQKKLTCRSTLTLFNAVTPGQKNL